MAGQQLDPKKQDVARKQGEAFDAALEIMSQDVDTCLSVHKDDYIITIACEEAEGSYVPADEKSLTWNAPGKPLNKHIEIVVQDADDHRFLPELSIRCTMRDTNGDGIAEFELPFMWHPFMFHYGSDVELPGEGDYRFSLTIGQPEFGRHDELNGARYKTAVQVDLGPLHLKPGRKPFGPE